MSFGKKPQNTEIKHKEKTDENFRNTISDKLMEIINKNNFIKEKIDTIISKNYLIREDEDFVQKYLIDILNSLESVKNHCKNFENHINRKYANDIDSKDKYHLIRQHLLKILNKEIENYSKNVKLFETSVNNLVQNSEAHIDSNENSDSLLEKPNEEEQKFKVKDGQIKHIEEVASFRKKKFENIYKQTLLVQEITSNITSLTRNQEEKLVKIDDHLEPVQNDAKIIYRNLLQTSEEEKKFKANNCCLMMLIVLLIFFGILMLIYWH